MLWLFSMTMLFILLPRLFQLWILEAPFVWLLCLLICSHPFVFSSTSLLSGTRRCFKRLIMYIFCPSPRIRHIFKELSAGTLVATVVVLFLIQKKIWNVKRFSYFGCLNFVRFGKYVLVVFGFYWHAYHCLYIHLFIQQIKEQNIISIPEGLPVHPFSHQPSQKSPLSWLLIP